MAGALDPELPVCHVGSQGVAPAVSPKLLLATLVLGTWRELWVCFSLSAMLVYMAWRELWAWGFRAAMLLPRAWQEP